MGGYGRSDRNLRMPKGEKLQLEKELLGFYVSGHPLDEYGSLPACINQLTPGDLPTLPHRMPFRLCGVVSGLQKRFTRNDGRQWATFTLSTRLHSYSMTMFSKAFETTGPALEESAIVGVHGFVANRDGDIRLNVQEVFSLESRMPQIIQGVTWYIRDGREREMFLRELREAIEEHPGETHMRLGLLNGESTALVAETAGSLTLHATRSLLLQLQNHQAVCKVDYKLADLPVFEKNPY